MRWGRFIPAFELRGLSAGSLNAAVLMMRLAMGANDAQQAPRSGNLLQCVRVGRPVRRLVHADQVQVALIGMRLLHLHAMENART